MAVASRPVLDLTTRLLTWRRPGRMLGLLARAPVPVLYPDRLAGRRPEPGLDGDRPDPFVTRVDPAPPAGDGPLAGARVVVKDAFDVRGLATGLGLRDGGEVAADDAAVVARIRAAGGWIVAKTVMTELGTDGLGALVHQPMPRNPVAPGYFPGGSSTGTAVAVASGLARYGLGSDGLGSVRIPAAFCGLVGLKPGHGRLPAAGYRSPVHSLDVPGPIATSVADCARLWQVMAGEPIAEVEARVPDGIAVITQLGPDRAARVVRAGFERALAHLGVRPRAADLPGAERCTFLGGLLGAAELVGGPLADRELSPAGRMNVALGRALSPVQLARMRAQRDALRDATLRALAGAPILAMPTTAVPPPALTRALLAGGQDLVLLRAVGAYTPLANLTGLPAIAVPCGTDRRGRPLSIMFMAGPGGEATLLALAAALERTRLGAAPL